MTRIRRLLIVLSASACGLMAFAGSASADLLLGANGAGNNPSNLVVLDPSTGSVIRTVGPIGFGVTGLAIDPTTGTLYGATGRNTGAGTGPNPVSLIRINRTTGAGSLVGKFRPDNEGAADLTFTPDGTLYGWLEPNTDDLIRIDKATGVATVVGDSGLDTYGSGIASNSAGVLYFAGEGDQGRLFTIDRGTGAATPIATLDGATGNPGISALAFDSSGTLFGARLPSNSSTAGFASDLITIDTATGHITSKGPSIDRLDALVFVPPRHVTLKKKLKNHGTKVKLSGKINDPTDPACVGGQTVQIQRKKLGKSKGKKKKFKTFKTRTTNKSGAYSTKAKVKQSFKYRAFAPEGPTCDAATSKVKKVKA
jgi:DNA-binding beta-propeller fold protein YncE